MPLTDDAARGRRLVVLVTAAIVLVVLTVLVLALPRPRQAAEVAGGTPMPTASGTPIGASAPSATGAPTTAPAVGLEATTEPDAGASPTAAATATSGGAATATSGGAATATSGGAATTPLAEAVAVDAVVAHLEALAALAEEDGGNRAAGLAGHDASAAYVREQLEDAGLVVEEQPLTIPVFDQVGPTELSGAGTDAAWVDGTDFVALAYSPPGDVTGPVVGLGASGCAAADVEGVAAGSVVVAPAGGCALREKARNALEAGAAAVLIATPLPGGAQAIRATLLAPDGITGPVVGVADAVAEAVVRTGGDVRVVTRTRVEEATSPNVVAETTSGDAGAVVVLGAHLDTVVDGPGMNDNGSGSATILEIARQAAARELPVRLRVAFWTGEELSLAGSSAYVRGLDAAARAALRAYLNVDMVASPNPVMYVYDQELAPTGSEQLTDLFGAALDAAGAPWEPIDPGRGGDHHPFVQAGVPIGGLYTGSSELLAAEHAASADAVVGAPHDPCYHRACDVLGNADPATLAVTVPAAATVVEQLLSGAAPLPR